MDTDLQEALISLSRRIVFDSRDWSIQPVDAWLWGVLVGWGCQENHKHDEYICGGDKLDEQAARLHGWNAAELARLRRFRAAVSGAQNDPAPRRFLHRRIRHWRVRRPS